MSTLAHQLLQDNRRVDKLTLHAGDEESWGKWRYVCILSSDGVLTHKTLLTHVQILIRWELSKYGKLPDSQESGYHVL